MLEIAKEMPCMIDSREYLETVIKLPDDEHYSACKTALDNEMLLFVSTISNLLFYKNKFSTEYKIEAIEKCISVLETVYDDGNYGSCYRSMIYIMGNLGQLHFEKGDTRKAIKYLTRCAELAKTHDNLPSENAHHSLLLEGAVYTKTKYGKTMCERMKHNFLNNYLFPEEFKKSWEFLSIINMLE